MSASRPSYEVSLISEDDDRWAKDKSQSHCYVCTRVKLSKGKRHHCRLCGNISCRDCCPRICKRCLAENMASTSRQLEPSQWEQIERLFQRKSQRVRWKKVEMVDSVHFEPVYVISENDSDCIIRTVDGHYFRADSSVLFAAPHRENMLDSLQCLLHGFMNRSAESSLSLKKPLYALQPDRGRGGHSAALSLPKRLKKRDHGAPRSIEDERSGNVLRRCQIDSFYPMLQREGYKLEGFVLRESSSFNLMKLDNVQFFHFVADQESPKEIPAYTPPTRPPAVTAAAAADDDDRKVSRIEALQSAQSEAMLPVETRRKSASVSKLGYARGLCLCLQSTK